MDTGSAVVDGGRLGGADAVAARRRRGRVGVARGLGHPPVGGGGTRGVAIGRGGVHPRIRLQQHGADQPGVDLAQPLEGLAPLPAVAEAGRGHQQGDVGELRQDDRVGHRQHRWGIDHHQIGGIRQRLQRQAQPLVGQQLGGIGWRRAGGQQGHVAVVVDTLHALLQRRLAGEQRRQADVVAGHEQAMHLGATQIAVDQHHLAPRLRHHGGQVRGHRRLALARARARDHHHRERTILGHEVEHRAQRAVGLGLDRVGIAQHRYVVGPHLAQRMPRDHRQVRHAGELRQLALGADAGVEPPHDQHRDDADQQTGQRSEENRPHDVRLVRVGGSRRAVDHLGAGRLLDVDVGVGVGRRGRVVGVGAGGGELQHVADRFDRQLGLAADGRSDIGDQLRARRHDQFRRHRLLGAEQHVGRGAVVGRRHHRQHQSDDGCEHDGEDHQPGEAAR